MYFIGILGVIFGCLLVPKITVSADADAILNLTEVNKTVMINQNDKSIDTLPWGTNGYITLGQSSSFMGKVVTITQESSNYAYSPELKGWIDKKGIDEVTSTNIKGTIQNAGYTIDALPWYDGVKNLSNTTDHLNEAVTVSAKNGSYYYVANLGWIDKKAFNPSVQQKVDDTPNSNTDTGKQWQMANVNLSATVKGDGKTIDSLPWGNAGFQNVSQSNDFAGQHVKLTLESGDYVYSPELKGWIDKKGLTFDLSNKTSWPFDKAYTGSFEDGQQFGDTGYNRGGQPDPYFHDGFDFGSVIYGAGSQFKSVTAGKVIYTGIYARWSGAVIVVQAPDGNQVMYQEFSSDMQDVFVKTGDTVESGQVIGRMTGPHLHIGITSKDWQASLADAYNPQGPWIDPIAYIQNHLS
ncbi:GW dipeptide domain-containing protein [Lacticaseibacillus chiayiensis]|uniref:GW dipeptide domain-containing protein n=1 Tax=Lacticaseibacillus chiayiensis TaxID=2100821 RepID=UPI003C73E417